MLLRLVSLALVAVGLVAVSAPVARADAPKFESGDYDLQIEATSPDGQTRNVTESVKVEITAAGDVTITATKDANRPPLKGKLSDGKLVAAVEKQDVPQKLRLEGTVTKENEVAGDLSVLLPDLAPLKFGKFRLVKPAK